MKLLEKLEWNVLTVYKYYDTLNLLPDFQRKKVWSTKDEQYFIDSLLRHVPTNKVFFRKSESPAYDFEVAEGQQRIRAIYRFLNNKFRLSARRTPEFARKFYKDLPNDVKRKLDGYSINIEVLDATDEEIGDMFIRWQSGKPIKPSEARNSMIGSGVRNFVASLVNTHPVFKVYYSRDYRNSTDHTLAQCVLLELTGYITTVSSRYLSLMYENHKMFDAESNTARRIKRILNYMARVFKEPTYEFNKRTQFVSVYWLLSQLLDSYDMSGREDQFRQFFVDFDARVKSKESNEFSDYLMDTVRRSEGADQIKQRHSLLMREWFLFAPDLKLLDTQRNFTEEQRIAIYRRDKGICQLCGNPVEFSDMEADHIYMHKNGGSTTVENGQAAHKRCNKTKQKSW